MDLYVCMYVCDVDSMADCKIETVLFTPSH